MTSRSTLIFYAFLGSCAWLGIILAVRWALR